MNIVNKIRKEFRSGKKIDPIAKKYNCSWATVNTIINSTEDELAMRGHRTRPKVILNEAVEKRLVQLLDEEDSKNVHLKQRYKSPAIYKILKSEKIFNGSPRYLRQILKKIKDQRKTSNQKTYLELSFTSGEYLQIDHGEADVVINHHRITGYLFVAAVPGKVLRFCQFFPTKSQEAWGEFHERSFKFFNGIFKYCIYDNDSVLKVAKTKAKTMFMDSLESHYGFEGIFCSKAAGWEKGAVENAVGYCRSNFMPGLPSYTSIEMLNNSLKYESHQDSYKEHYIEKVPKNIFLIEIRSRLLPMTSEKVWGKWSEVKINSMQLFRYDKYQYSIPEKFVGSTLKTFVTVNKITLYDGHDLVYSHDRLFWGEKDALVLDHYLDQISRKPNAYRFSKVVQETNLTPDLETIREILFSRLGESNGAREFIQVLLLKRVTTADNFATAIQFAISYGGVTSNAVSSFIKQLELESTHKECPRELISEDLLRHSVGEFDLYIYQQLITDGGF
jgi:transposase